ncbi:transcription factor [Ganoderma sinense ZZ0214-1]|uniref:Transcription factor n=1 Tax=Ganoderma sinense ZZ0214-1 TaxID=1077348 RepID=A0A2G8RUD8_9APHY|nr:transcription factor [Ganoderma sinense ZZ0214-1]
MASSVFYKFRSQRDESRVTFDGTGISVFDLKKEIIIANNLSKANDFDLVVLDSSGEEYKDDSSVIPRSSSVIVKRVPARPGRGAARYLGAAAPSQGSSDGAGKSGGGGGGWRSGGGNISKRFDAREPKDEPKPMERAPAPAPVVKSVVTQEDEAEAMAAMFQAQTANWEEAQEKMSHAVKIYSQPRGGAPRGGKPYQPSHHHSDRPLPPSYVCYRCGQKGHWIQDCPTNNDREFDNRPRIKRTTGIPRSFLKAVENPTTGPLGAGVMVTPEGGYVVAQPDSASWQKQVSRHKGLTEADIRERPPSDPSLQCPIDSKLFRDAVKTPCCGTLYCEECVQTHLLERDFLCPNCARKIPSLDKLIVDKPTRARVHDYVDGEIERSRQEAEKAERQEREKLAAEADGAGSGDKEGQKAGEGATGGEGEENFFGDAIDVAQIISQLQAQIQQVQAMVNNMSIPQQARHQAQLKHQQLQMELQQAQAVGAAMAAAQSFNMPSAAMGGAGMGAGMGGAIGGGMGAGGMGMQGEFRQWTNPFPNQQPAGQDSAYQRLPLNNRRRPLKRDRPSDFLEIAGAQQGDAKAPRFWE